MPSSCLPRVTPLSALSASGLVPNPVPPGQPSPALYNQRRATGLPSFPCHLALSHCSNVACILVSSHRFPFPPAPLLLAPSAALSSAARGRPALPCAPPPPLAAASYRASCLAVRCFFAFFGHLLPFPSRPVARSLASAPLPLVRLLLLAVPAFAVLACVSALFTRL